MGDNLKFQKVAKKFYCELCDFKCSNKKVIWNRHLLTLKHQNELQNGYK